MQVLLEQAVVRLGGLEGLVKWVNSSKANKTLFWSSMAMRLLPVQVRGTGLRGEVVVEIKPEDLERELKARGLPVEIFGRDVPTLDLTPEDDPSPQRH